LRCIEAVKREPLQATRRLMILNHPSGFSGERMTNIVAMMKEVEAQMEPWLAALKEYFDGQHGKRGRHWQADAGGRS
jgi:hypothetical protein